jgi:FkbM family methyltransferase
VLKLLLIPFALVAGFHVVAYLWYPADVAFVMVLGSSEGCTWEEALESRRQFEEAKRESAAAAPKSRLIRTEGEFEVWDTPVGERWFPQGYEFIGGGSPRWTVTQQVEAPINPGDIVLDCGGHTGGSASAAVAMGAGLVVSFEPDPINAECMRRNLKHEIESGKVIIYELGVWDKDEKLFLQKGGHSADAVVSESSGIGIGLTTIDKVVADLGLERVDFIKMDIEGSEQRAIVGARETIRRFKPRMAIGSYHREDDLREIPRLVNETRTDYEMACLRCFQAYGKMMPHLLYFH